MAARTRGTGRWGFSLIELLFAVAILASGFLLVLGMFPTSFRGVHQGKHHLIASQLTQAYMDQERSKAFPTMANGTYSNRYTVVVNGVPSSARYTTTVTVRPSPAGGANKASILVQTQWIQAEVTGSPVARSITVESTRTRAY